MLGCVYLILAALLGREITHNFLPEQRMREKGITPLWVTFAASFGSGVLLMTWAVYIAAWLLSVYSEAENPLFGANLMVMAAVGIFLLLCCYRRKGSFGKFIKRLSGEVPPAKEIVFLLILLAGITWIMVFVFHVSDGYLYSGFTVFGDYAPHTAMMRSFSLGNNFPTQYPHFGGEDVKYHFMFQFLAGNLEYLGMRMDVAYNIVSLTSLTGFLMLLYQLALRITGKMCCGVLTIFLFFFRSGMAFYRFVWEHIQAGNLLETLTENVSFIGYTTNENWGLWNFNVYLNQRHLAFGLLMVTLALYLFMDWLETGTMHEEKGFVWMKERLFSKEGWRSRNLEQALLMGLFLGLCAFWNGAAVIGGLLILCGFAVFSDGKLDYLIMAAVTIFFSYLQTKIFISGSAMSPQIYLGFLAEDKTVWGVVKYLFWMSGVFFLGLLVLVWFMRRRERAILLGFIFPTIFAFVLLMTPDINVNHKYIMISYAFLTIFWAWTICNFWTGERVKRNVKIADERKTEDIENEIKKETSQSDVKTGRDRKIRKFAGKVLAAILTICLSITGIYDFAVIVKGNGPGRRVAVNMNSDLTCWLAEHLDKNDLLLTPEYSMNEVTMSGVMLYCGWPYYAWSAGYDTNYRAAQAVTIYTTSDSETLKSTVKQEKITYILFEEGSEFEQQVCQEKTIAATYEKVYETQDGRIRIYKTN